jgi:hypothetical protein
MENRQIRNIVKHSYKSARLCVKTQYQDFLLAIRFTFDLNHFMTADIINVSSRADFERVYGRPVKSHKDMEGLKKTRHISEIPYGLTSEFYDYFEKLVISHLVNEYQLIECLRLVDQVLDQDPPAMPHDNENKKYRSAEIVELHDDILHSMDVHLGFFAYLMKINALMPSISAHYSGHYTYSKMDYDPISGVTKYMDNIIYLESFCDIDSVISRLNDEADGVFGDLLRLQSAMSDGQCFDRIGDENRDEFCALFLDNQEMDRFSVADRIEWDFMKRYEFPLGVLDTSPNVSKALAGLRSEKNYLLKIQKRLSDGRSFILYPGLTLRTGDERLVKTDDVKRSISRQGMGPFSPKGLSIG